MRDDCEYEDKKPRVTIRFTDDDSQLKSLGLQPSEIELVRKHGARVMEWLKADSDNPRRFAASPREIIAKICPDLVPVMARFPKGRYFDPKHAAPQSDPNGVHFTVGKARR